MKTIADRLKYARGLKQWTQAQLAIAAGIPQSTVCYTESGKRQSKGSLPLIAQALGINERWLAAGEGEMQGAGSARPAPAPFSPGALELAELYDMIPRHDRIRRAQAYAAASKAILDVLEAAQATRAAAQALKTPAR
jgi:transcriptional regulator with XRE-family HTH domain